MTRRAGRGRPPTLPGKPHSIKFTEADWQNVQFHAGVHGVTNAMICRAAVRAFALAPYKRQVDILRYSQRIDQPDAD